MKSKNKLSILSPSGGLGYHARALLNRRRWQPFKIFVEEWLLDWLKKVNLSQYPQLVLIGPNAGYTLSKRFVQQFSRVVIVEPDPVAYLLFESRFLCQAKWVRHDYFGLNENPPNPEKLRDLFTAHENSVFLFCNILGQLPVILRDQKVDVEKYMKDLGVVLNEVAQKNLDVKFKNSAPDNAQYIPLASYHDRFSRDLRKPNEIVDHLTGELFSSIKDKKEFPWRISSREEHQIEFVRN